MIQEKSFKECCIRLNCPQGNVGSPSKNLKEFKMEADDALILKIIYKTFGPRRHLEIGTWKGFGAKLALQNSSTTVWTVNPWEGETKIDGDFAYSESVKKTPTQKAWWKILSKGKQENSATIQTDAGNQIGHLYREAQLGGRVCQIYSDSRQWDTSNYPAGFFDSVLIDGSHEPEMVVHDTRKTTPLLRSGGIMLWHDYCPDPEVIQTMSSVRGVTRGIEMLDAYLKEHFSECFWINPSWLLVGIKK